MKDQKDVGFVKSGTMGSRTVTLMLALLLCMVGFAGCAMEEGATPEDPSASPTASVDGGGGVPQANPATEPTEPPDEHPPEEQPTIRPVRYLEYYLYGAGWEIDYDGGKIFSDAPSGTGSEYVAAYIQPTGEEAKLLTPYMGIGRTYLAGDWLYFWYADTDTSVYEHRRINIRTLEEQPLPEMSALYATEEYFYYFRDDAEDSRDLYRRDARFEGETPVMSDIGPRDLYAMDRHLMVIEDDPEDRYSTLTVYDQDGRQLHKIQTERRMAWNHHHQDGVFYWCDWSDSLPLSIGLNTLDLQSGQVESVQASLDVEGDDTTFVLGVVDVDETDAYITVNGPYPENPEGISDNTYLYRMPLVGGDAEFVRSWFES